MQLTNVTYQLELSNKEIIVTSLEFHGTMKTGGHSDPDRNLSYDRDEANSKYGGTFLNVIVNDDCSLLKKIAVTAEGPSGSSMKLTAKVCESKKLTGEPIVIDDGDGSLTEVIRNITLVS